MEQLPPKRDPIFIYIIAIMFWVAFVMFVAFSLCYGRSRAGHGFCYSLSPASQMIFFVTVAIFALITGIIYQIKGDFEFEKSVRSIESNVILIMRIILFTVISALILISGYFSLIHYISTK